MCNDDAKKPPRTGKKPCTTPLCNIDNDSLYCGESKDLPSWDTLWRGELSKTSKNPMYFLIYIFWGIREAFFGCHKPVRSFREGKNCIFFGMWNFWQVLVVYRSALHFLAVSRSFWRPWVDGNQNERFPKRYTWTIIVLDLCQNVQLASSNSPQGALYTRTKTHNMLKQTHTGLKCWSARLRLQT